jgi:hypothetical protein
MVSSFVVQGAGYKLPIDADGFLYLSTGNGDFNADPSNFNANGFPIDGKKAAQYRTAASPTATCRIAESVWSLPCSSVLSTLSSMQATTQTPCSSEFACGRIRSSEVSGAVVFVAPLRELCCRFYPCTFTLAPLWYRLKLNAAITPTSGYPNGWGIEVVDYFSPCECAVADLRVDILARWR